MPGDMRAEEVKIYVPISPVVRRGQICYKVGDWEKWAEKMNRRLRGQHHG